MGAILQKTFFKCICVKEKFGIWIKITLKFVRKDLIDDKSPFLQVTACRRNGDKP